MYSGPITIFERLGYRLDSYGNGAAHCLTWLGDGASVFFQGDDSDAFRAEFEVAESCRTPDRAILDLFGEYDSVMALPE